MAGAQIIYIIYNDPSYLEITGSKTGENAGFDPEQIMQQLKRLALKSMTSLEDAAAETEDVNKRYEKYAAVSGLG